MIKISDVEDYKPTLKHYEHIMALSADIYRSARILESLTDKYHTKNQRDLQHEGFSLLGLNNLSHATTNPGPHLPLLLLVSEYLGNFFFFTKCFFLLGKELLKHFIIQKL